ncbi:MAG: hypothetical protein ACXVWF_01670 [Actinomycetota bacterium]
MSETEVPDAILVALPSADVVWAHRMAPDRAVLVSIPEPASGFRWLDEVRLIPSAVADIRIEDAPFEVLAAPERVEGSGIPTTLADVASRDATDLATLLASLGEHGWRGEDWTEQTTVVCASCIDAQPDPSHRHDAERWYERHTVAIAGQPTEVETVLRLWIEEAPERRVLLDLDEAP